MSLQMRRLVQRTIALTAYTQTTDTAPPASDSARLLVSDFRHALESSSAFDTPPRHFSPLVRRLSEVLLSPSVVLVRLLPGDDWPQPRAPGKHLRYVLCGCVREVNAASVLTAYSQAADKLRDPSPVGLNGSEFRHVLNTSSDFDPPIDISRPTRSPKMSYARPICLPRLSFTQYARRYSVRHLRSDTALPLDRKRSLVLHVRPSEPA